MACLLMTTLDKASFVTRDDAFYERRALVGDISTTLLMLKIPTPDVACDAPIAWDTPSNSCALLEMHGHLV